jgi:hypothetical protein
MTRRSTHSPLLDRRPPKTPVPQPGFSSREPCDAGSIRHGCTFDTGSCRHMRRRNSRLGRLLDRSGVAVPQFIEAWSLTNTRAGWLAGIVSALYMLAVIPLVSFTDRRPARQIYLASSALSALSCFGMALCDSLLPALAFRALAGIAVAGMYTPGSVPRRRVRRARTRRSDCARGCLLSGRADAPCRQTG